MGPLPGLASLLESSCLFQPAVTCLCPQPRVCGFMFWSKLQTHSASVLGFPVSGAKLIPQAWEGGAVQCLSWTEEQKEKPERPAFRPVATWLVPRGQGRPGSGLCPRADDERPEKKGRVAALLRKRRSALTRLTEKTDANPVQHHPAGD